MIFFIFTGGTCVNVGCIPKKLFHAGSLLREAIHSDAASFGISLGGTEATTTAEHGETTGPLTTVQWSALRENIQNYIRSLNFKYRVLLREENVTYLNKLGKFVDKNTIEVTDKKGVTSKITSSRFLIATGGRPAPLTCEGAELAISSDDVFAMEKSPGKTLSVGASYISLECAGYLAGLGFDTTVAVRSILLRGFDRECADKIGTYMQETGIKFRREVTPEKLAQTENGQIDVTFSDGSQDVYDTVLAAVGRMADTDKLGLDAVGVKVNPKNLRILGKHEQTDCPNVYAVGDVLDVRTTVLGLLNSCILVSVQWSEQILFTLHRERPSLLRLPFRQEYFSLRGCSVSQTNPWITSMCARLSLLLLSILPWEFRKTTPEPSTAMTMWTSIIASFCR